MNREANLQEIKKAYKRLALIHHPDKGGDPEYFKKILEAYSVLTDKKLKKDYDKVMNSWIKKQKTKKQPKKQPKKTTKK